jgi:hypothetical protein
MFLIERGFWNACCTPKFTVKQSKISSRAKSKRALSLKHMHFQAELLFRIVFQRVQRLEKNRRI